jgi:sugar fermentation stimulation protein A
MCIMVSENCAKQKWYSLPLSGRPVFRAAFISRPNRFLVLCEDECGHAIRAFLPNPGRLSELLFKGVTLHILDNDQEKRDRATSFTVLAVEREGIPVMLHTHWCNEMVHSLLRDKAVPGLEQARVKRREIRVGRSRFDFLLEDDEGELYLEVKSCTLFGNGVAMFPDAVTDRGRRHLLELNDIAQTGTRCRVLFVVQTDHVKWFMPDYHTDLAFALTMLTVQDNVQFMALPVNWNRELSFRPGKSLLQIPWGYIEREAQDKGAYLAVLQLNRPVRMSVGALGDCFFEAGYYMYVGSAMNGLNARIARHARKRKKMHWHIDYLRAACELAGIVAIRASERYECNLANELVSLLTVSTPGFGCGDCHCASHLFYAQDNPLEHPRFQQWLQHVRMRPPSP